MEEKEKEFLEYVVEQLYLTLNKNPAQQQIRSLAHTLIQDFKEEIQEFDKVMLSELESTREELENAKDKLSKINAILTEDI